MAEQEGIVLPDFVSADWIISQLRISDDDAAKIGKELSVGDPSWEFVKDKATFAEQFLERFVDDPAIAAECRRVLGKKSPPVFAVPNSDPNAPGMLSARKCFGQYAARAHAALTSGDADTALDCIMLELLEFGGVAEEGFKFAQDVQHRDEYKQLVDIATKIQQRGYEIGLREDGLEAAEAEAEARSLVRQEYSFGKLAMLAESVSTSDTPVATLSKVAHALAEAARDATAYVQISTAPLGTDTAIVGIKEAVSILEAHLHGSEDEKLFELADQGKKLADSAQVQLLDRSIVCDARQRVAQIREKALEASSAADAAAAVPVKSMADAKKMAQAFEKANTLAKEACTMAIDCATILNEAKPIEPVDKAKELFEGIAAAFRGAEKGAAEETKKSADAAAAAQQEAKEASAQLDKEAAKAKVEKKAQAAKAKADEGKAEAEKAKAAEQLTAAKAKAEQEAAASAQEKAAEAEKKDAAPAKPEPAAKKQEAAPPAAAEQRAEPEKQDAAPTSRLGKLAAAVTRKAKRADAAPEEAAPPAQEKQIAPEPAPEAAAEEEPAGPSSEELREKLLAELDKFAGKRWDTDVATHALRRLVDRRKEIIGQLWEAVENKSPDMVDRADKFAQKFRNTMDARRRLDAVVRIVGRGKHMDPRTAKWFTDQIIAISKAAAAFADSA